MHVQSPLEDNLRAVRARIDRAAARAGRAPSDVALLPVTKAVPAAVARALCAAGCGDLGENRADALEEKAAALADLAPRWHFIGHLQRNKARRVVRLADVIHAVDTQRLLLDLERLAAEEDRRPALYLQVHATGEPEKHGFAPAELDAAVEHAARFPHVRLLGLMAMGPREDPDGARTRAVFALVHELAARLERAHPGAFEGGRCRLSMGMSGDLEDAVAAGATLVRVGSALFAGVHGESEARP